MHAHPHVWRVSALQPLRAYNVLVMPAKSSRIWRNQASAGPLRSCMPVPGVCPQRAGAAKIIAGGAQPVLTTHLKYQNAPAVLHTTTYRTRTSIRSVPWSPDEQQPRL